MNAPQTVVPCPTCKGSGKRVRAWDLTLLGGKRGKQVQRCVSCRGTGQVDPVRVCLMCGQWADQCVCAKSKIIKLWKVDEMNGVNWHEKQQRWRVEFNKNGEHYYMGQFPDKALAVRCRMEAENTPTDQYPALRQKYAELKKAAMQSIAPEPEPEPAPDEALIEAEVPDLADGDALHQKLAAARAADQRYQAIREQYCAAERDAVEAWNEYARELAAIGQGDAFARSYLGFLRE